MLTGCAPDLILPPYNADASADTSEVSAADAVGDAAPAEVSVPDAAADVQEVDVPDTSVPDDRDVSPDVQVADVQDASQVDTGSVDVGVDVPLPDAGPQDTGTDAGVDVVDVQDVVDVSDVQDAPDVVDVPVIPMDLGPPPCLPGQDRCGGMVCLNLSADTANCGGCGNVCPARPHAPATCSGGSCALVCDPGTLNCDGNLTNGCETLPSVDANNCGGCGTACQSFPHTTPSLCVGGVCSFGCGAGYANCDGLVTNGCEISTATAPTWCSRRTSTRPR